jgi:hypothetical protein
MPRGRLRPAGAFAPVPFGCEGGVLLLLLEEPPPVRPLSLGVTSPGPRMDPPPEDPEDPEELPLLGGGTLEGPRYWPPCACRIATVPRTAKATGRMREGAAEGRDMEVRLAMAVPGKRPGPGRP